MPVQVKPMIAEAFIRLSKQKNIDKITVKDLVEACGMTLPEVKEMLQKRSGFLGMSGGLSGDLRDVEAAAAAGNADCRNALDSYCYNIRKYLGAYTAAMGGLDAVLLTGGIGENSDELRVDICEGMEFLGIELDPAKNIQHVREDLRISKDGCKTEVWVIPPNEELAIALDTVELINK